MIVITSGDNTNVSDFSDRIVGRKIPKVGDKVRFVKDRYVELSHGIPIGSIGKVVEIRFGNSIEKMWYAYNPEWDSKQDGILNFWIDEIELVENAK